MTDEIKSTDYTGMPGEQLRKAREERGMTLDEAARSTCIGMSYLEALEADRYEQLPNPAYAKGIIRSYARILGVAPEPLIARYDKRAAPREEPAEQTAESGTPPRRKPWLLALIGAGIILAGYLLLHRSGGRDPLPAQPEQSAVSPSPGQAVLPPRTSHVRPVAVPAVPAPAPPRQETKDPAPAEAAKTAVLKAKVRHDCSLTITIDDTAPQQYDLKAGDQIEWMGERYFALEMTDAGAIDVVLNGKKLPPLGKSGDAATVVVTADGELQ